MSVDHRPVISKLFNEAKKKHGLTRGVLVTPDLKHVFSHCYRKSRQILGVGGQLYCSELWRVLGSPCYNDLPVFDYMARAVSGMFPTGIELSDELDVDAVVDYFDSTLSQAVVPIIQAIRTPIEAVEYARLHPGILGTARVASDRNLRRWFKHYGMDYHMPEEWDGDANDLFYIP